MVWLLLACADGPTHAPGPTPDSEAAPDSAPDSGAPRAPALLLLTDAEDLDPAEGSVRFHVRAEHRLQVIEDRLRGEVLSFEGYAYDGRTPGPTLRGRVGDAFELTLENALDTPTTIHWHGLDVPYEMDGVTWSTDPIAPGASFTYRFTLTRAGTYWYHPHFNADQQVDNGLYGLLIVEDPADPVPERELLLVFDDHAEPDAPPPPHGSSGDLHGVDGAEGLWTVNGLVAPELALRGGERVRVRALNASNTAPLALTWPGMRQIGGDQGLRPGLLTPEQVVLGPGDRAEFEWLIGDAGFEVLDLPYSHAGGPAWGEAEARLSVVVEAPGVAPEGLAWPFPEVELPEAPGHVDATYVFTGELLGPWLINGEAFPDVTVRAIPLGQPSVLEVRNLSASQHPFHLHGMRFEVLEINGAPPPHPLIEDTLMLDIRDAVKLRVVPEHAGSWMLHCHILEHAHGGMMTVLDVTD